MPIWLQPGHFHCTTQGFQRSKNNIQILFNLLILFNFAYFDLILDKEKIFSPH